MKCPKCGRQFKGHPALSREDNKTLICSECGTREALEMFGCDAGEQEHILGLIRGVQINSKEN